MAHLSERRFLREEDADLGLLTGKRIAVVGYGNLGRPLSLNLRDSGVCPITISELPGPATENALADGFAVKSAGAATANADIIFVLLPDELAPQVFEAEISPNLRPGCALVFASGYGLTFGQITPPSGIDVLMLAPRMMGAAIRDLYQQGQGFPSFVSVEQDATGHGWELLCALTKAFGSLSAGAIKISAAQETHLDLFVEQTVGPDLAGAILTAFQVGAEAGLPPEALLLELYMSGEMAKTFQAMADLGFFQQVKLHGFAAAYGGMIRFMGLDRESRERNYRQVLQEIQEGAFAETLAAEVESGFPSKSLLNEMLEGDSPVSQAEKSLRGMMRLNRVAKKEN